LKFEITMPPAVLIAFFFVFGTIIGSFLNVVIYRVPRKMSVAWPASHCPMCNHPIRWYHNVPVFGWLWLRGRCRDCGAKVSSRYPLVEFAVGLVFAAIGWLMIG
jgi:leader peptidase (prepilin peptidase) / N-methyltransferase